MFCLYVFSNICLIYFYFIACFCLIFHNVVAIYFHKAESFSEEFELDPSRTFDLWKIKDQSPSRIQLIPKM